MTKSIKAGALLVAGIFALSGCASSGEADSASESQSPAPESESSSSAPAVRQGQYTADELEAALTAVKSEAGLKGQIANDATLRPELEGVEDALSGITITPEECSTLASANIGEKVKGSNIAVIQLSATDALTVMSYEDKSLVEDQIRNNDQQMVDCTEFQMEAGGQIITASAEELDASTDSERTQAYSVAVDAGGQQTVTVQVNAFSGSTNIVINLIDPADPAAAVAEAEKTINAVLAELEKK